MGLDMYLNQLVDGEERELIYWRKANQVLHWFETHCANGCIENLKPIKITTYDLMNLLNDVNIVLEDHSKAEELLPTTSGFFFGGTQYDEWYFDNLEYTKKQLETVLYEVTEDDELEFYAWW